MSLYEWRTELSLVCSTTISDNTLCDAQIVFVFCMCVCVCVCKVTNNSGYILNCVWKRRGSVFLVYVFSEHLHQVWRVRRNYILQGFHNLYSINCQKDKSLLRYTQCIVLQMMKKPSSWLRILVYLRTQPLLGCWIDLETF